MQRMPILSDSDMSLFELKTRFVRNYFTYAGKNSKDFLLYLSAPGVYDSPEVDKVPHTDVNLAKRLRHSYNVIIG